MTVIDESLARRFWPGYPTRQDPIGQRLLIGGVNPKPAEVIGIVANVHQSLENDMWPETMYVAFAQNAQPFAMVAVRTAGDPMSFANAVRGRVRAVDRDQPVAEVRSMDDLVEEEVGQRRLLVLLLGAFAVVALLLAVIGIYGVVAYSVAQRTQEVGIRRALGAQQADILRLVVGHGFALAVTGIGLGLAAIALSLPAEAGLTALAEHYKYLPWVAAGLRMDSAQPILPLIAALTHHGWGVMLLGFLVIGLAPGIGEEMLFRGFLFNLLRVRLGLRLER